MNKFSVAALLAFGAFAVGPLAGAPAAAQQAQPSGVEPAKGPAARISFPGPPPGRLAIKQPRPRHAAAIRATPTAETPPLAVRGTDNGVWVASGGGYRSLAGYVIADPSTAVVPGATPEPLYVATGGDHALWIRNDTGDWRPLSSFPTYCVQGPAAVVSGTPGAYRLNVACAGSDGSLWEFSGAADATGIPSLTTENSLSGGLHAGPSGALIGGVATFFVIGNDGQIWERPDAGSWSQLQSVCFGHPETAVTASGLAVVACRGLDNQLWYQTSSGGPWSSPQPAGGELTEVLAARGMSDSVAIDGAGSNYQVYEVEISSGGVGSWSYVGGTVNPTAETEYRNSWIPVYRQQMPLDCEATAQQMALAGLGHWSSQSQLTTEENPDYRSAYWDQGGARLRWGNPYNNFVGSPSGDEGKYTGYGIYYPRLVVIAHAHGAGGSVGGQGFSPVSVYNAIANGHPVQAWVEYKWVRPSMGWWLTFDGSRWIHYSTWEHSVTLVGVTDSWVLVNDPGHGDQYWVSRNTFETSWGDFGNMALIYQ